MYSRKIKHRKTPGVHIKKRGKRWIANVFEKQLNFILEIDKEKQDPAPDAHPRLFAPGGRRGARMAHGGDSISCCRNIRMRKIDIGRTMLMLLIHDLVEIDAGDTYA